MKGNIIVILLVTAFLITIGLSIIDSDPVPPLSIDVILDFAGFIFICTMLFFMVFIFIYSLILCLGWLIKNLKKV